MQELIANGVTDHNERGWAATLAVLVGWFFIAVWLGVNGTLATTHAPPLAFGVAVLSPLVVFAMDRRMGHPLFQGLLRLELPALIGLQTFRVVGVVFLVAWLGASLPAGFALPAGIGDVAIGIAALFVASAVAARTPHHRPWAMVWNTLGVVDLVVAVGSGITHGSSALGVFRGPVTTDGLARYPFSVIPTFFVPLAILLHFLTWKRLKSGSRR